MTRYLLTSAGLHGLALAFFLLLPSPKPPRFYGIDFLGGPGGAGPGGGAPAPAALPERQTVTPAAPKPETEAEAPEPEAATGHDRDRLLIKKKKTAKPAKAKPQKKTPPAREVKSRRKIAVKEEAPPEVTNLKGVKGGAGSSADGVPGAEGAGASLVIGGSGPGGGGGLGPGGGSGLGKRFPYAWYINLLYKRLWDSWDSRNAGGKECTLSFVIHREGNVSDVDVEQSSGDSIFDLLARRAVENAAPFPPLPQDYPEPDLPVYVKFKLQ